MKATCIRVGNGAIAQIHEEKLRGLGVHTLALVETSPERRALAASRGLLTAARCDEVAGMRPTFWDICTPTHVHVDVLEAIIACDPTANILIEKPVCAFSDIPRLRQALAGFCGRLCINENYCSSSVTQTVRSLAAARGLQISHIAVEMTKNRIPDFASGRYIDDEFGAIGYEGPHMLAIIQHLGQQHLPGSIIDIGFVDAVIPTASGSHLLPDQGSTDLTYIALSGVEVDLYTALNGHVKYGFAPYSYPGMVIHDTSTKHRIVQVAGTAADGTFQQIVGFYEPIRGRARSEGAVGVFRDGTQIDLICPIPDDTIGTQLHRALCHFNGDGENPCDVEQAMRIVTFLEQCARPTIGQLRT